MKYENQILEAIETIVNHRVNSAGYDKTIQAKIINCADATIGKYKVQYQDSIFYAYSNSSEVSYVDGSEVYILVPSNDMSRDKTILGSVNKLGKNYAVSAEGEEAFEIIGNNCVEDNKEYSLCSYKTQEKIIYQHNSSSSDNLRLNLKSIEEYIKSSSSITLAATIKTSLPTEQQFRGNYGISYEIVFNDNATGKEVSRNYVLDVNQFEGNPYKIPNFKRQVGIFDIDSNNFQRIEKITIFCYDFPNQDDNKKDDIIIKDLEICGSQPLNAADLESCSLSFVTPQGVYFDNNDLDSATRTIKAQVRVKGKYINPDSQKLPYYWFVENNGVTSLSEDFNAYGGQGWKCLNQKNVIKNASAGTAPVVEWIPADFKYIVKKSDSEAKETKYKCVVIYNNIQLSRIITVTNYSSNYEISIESDSGEQFYYDIGNPILTCKINGQESTSNEYTYQWVEIDNNNNFYALSENTMSLTKVNSISEMINNNNLYILTTNNCIYYYKNSWINTTITVNSGDNDNDIYNKTVASYTQLKADIAAERAMAAASQDLLEGYLTIINSYDKIMRIEGRKIHHLQVNTITNFSTYKCSVYHNGIYIGTASIVIRNDLDKKDAYTLIINNGSQTFKYNESGISPTSDSLDNPQVILPLNFTVYDNLGNPIDNDIISQCKIKWYIPDENTMIKIKPDTYALIDQGNYQMILDEMSINYLIAERYDIKKNNNNIKLTVDYKGMNLVAETDFTFVKEGEPGTNGTEFVCKIVPNTPNTNFGYPMILNGNINYTPRQTGKWFEAELWHNGAKIYPSKTPGQTTEGKPISIEWSILRNKYITTQWDETSLSVTKSGTFSYSGYKGANSPANIVKVIITYDNGAYYATLPVITATAESRYGISLIEGSGFRYATYSADGRRPQYDNSNPFELKVTKVINGITEDISTLTQVNGVNYDWHIRGRIYDPVNRSWVNKEYIKEYSRSDIPTARNTKSYKPIDDFDGECVTNALECIVIDKSANEVARIHIPIHLMLNRYGHAALNDWDGNSVSIDKDGNGVILAPQIGAGQKEKDPKSEYYNSFTGMLMGTVKETGRNDQDIGLFGYHHGQRSLFLNSKNGSVILGKNGPGQIILDPTSSHAMLYSNGFWSNYHNSGDNVELPVTDYGYNANTRKYNGQADQGVGMLIDLTSARIVWNNGNFAVDENGHITAKGGGTIAGFNIDDDSIYTGTKSSSGNVRFSSSDGVFTRTINGTSRENLNLAINNKFAVDRDGKLYAHDAIISGDITADSGRIGGFTITNSSIYNNKESLDSENSGVYIGTDGISLGVNSTFKVTRGGSLTARTGEIGGWIINGTELLSNNGNTHITSGGSLRGPNWSIDSNGNAYFRNVRIDNGAWSQGTADLINYGNRFRIESNGTLHASNGQFSGNISGSSISGGTVSGATVTGGSINISTAGGGYLRAGLDSTNVRASGITVGTGGINMSGNGISNVSIIGIGTIAPNEGSTGITCTADFIISGGLYAGAYQQFYRGVDSGTMYVRRTDAQGNDNGYYLVQINRGIIHNLVAYNP